jgi:hypothetical protein
MKLAIAVVTNRTVEREGVVIELDQLRTAHRAEFLFFAGEEVEFVVHGNIPGGVVDGVESERGINIVPHGAPPMEILSCRDPSFARIFVPI